MHGNNSDFVTGVWISVLVLHVWKYLHAKKKTKHLSQSNKLKRLLWALVCLVRNE